MGNAFRRQPGPALYGENKTPVSQDVLEVGLLFAASLIAFSFVLIIVGIRGWERLWATIRVFVALWVGTVILVSNFGHGWYIDTICTRTQYKAYVSPAGSHQEIEADVGLHIGLRGTNITLRESACISGINYEPPFPGEEIDYNERYYWADPWSQGRLGFGRFAGRYNQEFRAAQFRGTPYPILWIAEYFTLDGELIRWGRKFRLAGWYGHILLWTAFATYLIAILLFIFNIQQGAKFTVITGCLMILSVFAYGVIIINDPPLELPFQDAALNRSTSNATTSNATTTLPSTVLKPSFGWSWWLTLWTGVGTFFLGIFILFLNRFWPNKAAVVFHHSVLADDEFFAEEDDEETQPKLDDYGVGAPGVHRGQVGRSSRSRTRRGLKAHPQQQQQASVAVEVEVIQLQEIPS